jgi:hypothetical protein
MYIFYRPYDYDHVKFLFSSGERVYSKSFFENQEGPESLLI